MPTVHEVDPHDDDALRAWHAALHAGGTAGRDAPVTAGWATLSTSLRDPGGTRRRLAVAAVESGTTVGALLLELPLAEDLTGAELTIAVPPERRGHGTGTLLWSWARRRAAAEGRTVLRGEVHVPAGHTVLSWPGARFATRHGCTAAHVEDHLVLPLPATVPVPATPPGYQVTGWTGICPAEHLAGFAAMSTVMARDVPAGELTREAPVWDADRVLANERRLARSYLSLVTLIRTGAGEPAGYTQLFVAHDDPDNVLQDDTFVARAHRGRRLSALLKAVNLRRLEPHRGTRRHLHTWTSDENPAMRRINAAFGFRVVEQTHTYERS